LVGFQNHYLVGLSSVYKVGLLGNPATNSQFAPFAAKFLLSKLPSLNPEKIIFKQSTQLQDKLSF
jgi:hypothetical protein